MYLFISTQPYPRKEYTMSGKDGKDSKKDKNDISKGWAEIDEDGDIESLYDPDPYTVIERTTEVQNFDDEAETDGEVDTPPPDQEERRKEKAKRSEEAAARAKEEREKKDKEKPSGSGSKKGASKK